MNIDEYCITRLKVIAHYKYGLGISALYPTPDAKGSAEGNEISAYYAVHTHTSPYNCIGTAFNVIFNLFPLVQCDVLISSFTFTILFVI